MRTARDLFRPRTRHVLRQGDLQQWTGSSSAGSRGERGKNLRGKDFLAKCPLSDETRAGILRVEEGEVDYFPHLTSDTKERQAFAHELQRLPDEMSSRSMRSRSNSIKPSRMTNGAWASMRGARAGLLGASACRLQRFEIGPRLDIAHGQRGCRIRRQRRSSDLSFPRRQRDDCASPCARSQFRGDAGQDRRGRDHGACKLCGAQSLRRAHCDPVIEHRRRRAQYRRPEGDARRGSRYARGGDVFACMPPIA